MYLIVIIYIYIIEAKVCQYEFHLGDSRFFRTWIWKSKLAPLGETEENDGGAIEVEEKDPKELNRHFFTFVYLNLGVAGIDSFAKNNGL